MSEIVEKWLIKHLKNFFVGKCGGYQKFFVYLQRISKNMCACRLLLEI